jgi:hypothetical protein
MKIVKIVTRLADRAASWVLREDHANAATKCYTRPIGGGYWARCYYNPGCPGKLQQTKYNCMWGPGASSGTLHVVKRRCC